MIPVKDNEDESCFLVTKHSPWRGKCVSQSSHNPLNTFCFNYKCAITSLNKRLFCRRYKRVFSIGTTGVTTYNPGTMEITNRWPYCDFMGALPGLNQVLLLQIQTPLIDMQNIYLLQNLLVSYLNYSNILKISLWRHFVFNFYVA